MENDQQPESQTHTHTLNQAASTFTEVSEGSTGVHVSFCVVGLDARVIPVFILPRVAEVCAAFMLSSYLASLFLA